VKPNKIPAVSLTVSDLLPCVLPDNSAIGSLGADHLIELGYENFAFYFWQSETHELLRAKAFEEKLNPDLHHFYRINFTKTPRTRTQNLETRLRVLRRFLERAPKPIAIMAPLDDLAAEVIELCDDMGLNVPKEVGVLGVNNDGLICDFTPVPLSSIDDNEYRIGYEGAALLDCILKGRELPINRPLIQPQGVKIRKSTDLLEITEVTDRRVAMAVRFIAEHYLTPIKTDDVAAATGISKRPLQDRFTRHVGRSIHEQIVHKRVEHSKTLLRTTDDKTSYIAMVSGFGTRERFSKTFKQVVGINPIDFRQAES
jgi:LacI family transcriptional regulator